MYQTKSKSIPLNESYDVIVIGGGPAGCAAAVSAAREGAKTLVIEATGCLGGMATAGLVPAFCPYTDGEKVIYKGFAETVLTKMLADMPHMDPEKRDWVEIDAEGLKGILDDLVTGSGADVLFHSVLSDVDMDGDAISAVIIANKKGLSAYRAKMYIDCTGDGDLAAMSGCDYEMGDNGWVQFATHCFKLSGVAIENAPNKRLNVANDKEELTIYKLRDDPELDKITDTHICDSYVGTGTFAFNAGHIQLEDATDPVCVSRAMIEGRKIAAQFKKGLQKHLPALYKAAYLAETAPILGIRESRRIRGDYTLTIDDYVARRSFPDEIGRNCYYIDVHDGGHNKAKKPGESRYSKGESHGIPYRCMVPVKSVNLLTAGRIISSDRYVNGSVRIMPACFVTGEAAGCAAALIAQGGNGDVHTLNISLLRERLRRAGAYFL